MSDEQVAAYWDAVLANMDAARATAGKRVRKDSIEDVVHTAALKFLESLEDPSEPAKYPETDQEFRGRFLAVVRNHSVDCTRDAKKVKRPIHAFWGEEFEPFVGGRKVADRPLDAVYARNDRGVYDATAPHIPRVKDSREALNQLLAVHMVDLSPKQRAVVEETFFERRKRAEVARRHNMSVHTYDNHLQNAFRRLRECLELDADTYTGANRSIWFDLIDELRELYEESRLRHAAARKRSLSKSKGDASNSEGDAGKSARTDAA